MRLRRHIHWASALGILLVATLAAVAELSQGWDDRPPPCRGVGSLARIDPASVDPDVWRWASGVGPVLAGRIAAAAHEHPFRSWDDLRSVRGIGPVAASRLQQQIRWTQP